MDGVAATAVERERRSICVHADVSCASDMAGWSVIPAWLNPKPGRTLG